MDSINSPEVGNDSAGEAPQGQEEADDGIVDEEVLSSDDEQSDIDNDTTDTHNSREPPQRPQLPSVELVPDLYGLQCKCRCRCHSVCSAEQKSPEEDDYYTEWTWDKSMSNENTEVNNMGREVTFHKHFSNGTAAIKGSSPLKEGQHYWEIKMTTSVYGTDMMVGFGTKNVDLQAFATTFTSLLGKDSDSWGLSYTGNIIHNGLKRQVCKAFGKGVTIGVHLDMWLGKMSLFRNGKFVGVEFSKGIRGKEIYPMACSTAARTGMKIVRSSSFPTSLQFMCCQALRNAIPHRRDVTEAVNIAPGLKLFLLNNLDWLLRPHNPEQINEGVCSLRKRGSMKCAQDLLVGDDAVDGSESLKPTQPSERSPSDYLPPRKRRCFSDSQASSSYNRLDDSDDNTLL